MDSLKIILKKLWHAHILANIRFYKMIIGRWESNRKTTYLWCPPWLLKLKWIYSRRLVTLAQLVKSLRMQHQQSEILVLWQHPHWFGTLMEKVNIVQFKLKKNYSWAKHIFLQLNCWKNWIQQSPRRDIKYESKSKFHKQDR